MKVLVVAAHPDDETLGAGASSARWVHEGHEVSWLVLGEGTTSRAGATAETVAQQVGALEAAATAVGVGSVIRHSLPDNRFDTIALLDIVALVEEVVNDFGPSLVVSHHAGDVNVDHRRTADAVLAATRPVPASPVSAVWAMEVPSSTEWGFGVRDRFAPQVHVDVSTQLEVKLEALAMYSTEMRDSPHPRSSEAVAALAHFRGAAVGVAAAEAFELIRQRY